MPSVNLLSAHIFRVFAAVVAVLLSFSSCKEGDVSSLSENDLLVYECDAELSENRNGSLVFLSNDSIAFLGAEARCEDCGINNSAGIKLDSLNVYGFNITLKDLQVGEYFEVRIKEKKAKGHGAIVVKFSGGAKFNLASDKYFTTPDQDGWTTHALNFKVLKKIDTAEFFIHSGAKPAIFDDFQIKRYAEVPIVDTVFQNALTLHIPIKSDSILSDYLEYCVDAEIIPDEMKEYVKADLIDGSDSHKIEMRLKGDWTDHIKTGFSSFRIKTDDDFAYNGLRSFSIQHPRTRNYMHEWFFHRLLEEEDILTTTYDFVPVVINQRFQGVYALEEHFDKQLLESRNRREGPILKLDESGFWSALFEGNKYGFTGGIPYYEASYPSVFKSNRTRKNPVLLAQFLNGASLLEDFKSCDYNPENLFDIKKEAKFYALMEVGNIMHGLAWHNRRFYFNPITQKLEHIAYDLQSAVLPHNPIRLNTEMLRSENESLVPRELRLNEDLFEHEEFREEYIRYLKYYSSDNYLDSIFNLLEGEIKSTVELLRLSIPEYSFDKQFYYEHNEFVRAELDTALLRLEELNTYKSKTWSRTLGALNNIEENFFVKEVSLNAYVREIDSIHYEVSVRNYHLSNIEVLGFSNKDNKDSVILFESTYLLPSLNVGEAEKTIINVGSKPHALYFKANNMGDTLMRKKVFKWEEPPVEVTRERLVKKFKLSNSFFQVIEGGLKISAGKYKCSDLIYVPKDYKVYVEAGVEIDFTNEGGLITNNSTYLIGEVDRKIRITSSDSTSSGITILNADETIIQNVEVSNLNTLNRDGWILTGGVNVYESEVNIVSLSIYNAQGEDALNLIRCDFSIDQLLIDGTFSDGFDADFCTGTLNNSRFQNTGNDCIDFSGSVINGSKIEVENSGDKAISAGEISTVTFSDLNIKNAEIAFAAKDKSILTITTANVDGVKFGVTGFQKKPEYGPASLVLNSVTYTNVKNLGLLGIGSICEYDGNIFHGQFEVDVDQLYAKFNK